MSVRPVAAWRQMNNWFSSQGAATQQLLSAHQAAASAFSNAQASYFQGTANLAATAALNRVKGEAQAKNAALQQLLSGVGSTVNTVA
jgi:hypothetical protein